MFKHILLPTDGSPPSEAAVLKGIELAHEHKASVTGLHVSPRFHNMLEDTRKEYKRESEAQAARYLAFVSKAAAESGVACKTRREDSDDVSQTIVDVARERNCDLIVMGSHGRRGIGALLGSETNRVLVHSRIPVLVWR